MSCRIMFCDGVFIKCLSGSASWTSLWQRDSPQTDWLYQSPDTDAPANQPLIASLVNLSNNTTAWQAALHTHTHTCRNDIFTKKNKLIQNCQEGLIVCFDRLIIPHIPLVHLLFPTLFPSTAVRQISARTGRPHRCRWNFVF